MKERRLAALLCALLLLPLCACGRGGGTEPKAPDPARAPTESAPAAPARVSLAPSFPLPAAPFDESASEAMLNHACRRCALMVENYYYSGCVLSDGTRALLRFEVIDTGIYRPEILRRDCGADFLCERDGRLYYLGPGGRPESMTLEGKDCRTELDAACRSLQLFDGALCCLRADGTLLALRGGAEETLLDGCASAFVCGEGVFYTDAAEGRAHFYVPGSHSDYALTEGRAEILAVIGESLLYLAPEGGGLSLCALSLADGSTQRTAGVLAAAPDFFRAFDGSLQLRLSFSGGAQRVVPYAGVFDAALSAPAPEGEIRICRALDYDLHTDELLGPSGETLGFALVLPDGREQRYMAEDLTED